MSTSNIKWRDKDIAELKRQIKRYNAKVNRIAKKYGSDVAPQKLKFDEVKEQIYTRRDFNKKVQSVNRLFKKGVDTPVTLKSGVTTTKYQLREIEIQRQSINRKRKIAKEKSKASTITGTMGTLQDLSYKPKTAKAENVPISKFQDFVRNFEKQSLDSYDIAKKEQYKTNYLRSFKAVYGDSNGELTGKAKVLYDRFSAKESNEFIDMYQLNPILSLTFHYDKESQDNKLNQIELHLNAWDVGLREYEPR